jgi:pimeloyl-ACP methyl ester carboxylesterase
VTAIALPILRVRGAAIRIRRFEQEAGPDGARRPVCVFLHGYPDTLRVFEPFALALRDTHDALLFDWPGQGRSEDLGIYDPWDRAAFVADLLDAAGIDEAVFVAHDMGVLPALAFAQRSPKRLSKVVVAHALLDDAAPVSLAIAILRTARLYRHALRFAPELVFDRCLASFLAPGHALTQDALAEMRRDFVARRENVVSLCRAYDAALPTFLASVGACPTPMEIVWSNRKGHFPRAHGEALARRVPSAHMTVLPDAPHWSLAQGGSTFRRIVARIRA